MALTTHNDNPYRLPRNVIPVRYVLTLEPDLENATFQGTSETLVDVVEPTDRIVLNAAELELHEAWIIDDTGTRIDSEAIDLDETTERATIQFTSLIGQGAWTLHLRFDGILNNRLRGFYRSTFTDSDGNEQVIATTQLEATDARRAFPCWDEPDLKAVFSVTLVVEEGLTALSNAQEIARTVREDGKVAITFADTMRMSTYLLAFIVGPLEVTEPVEVDGKPLRIAYPRGKGHLTSYAREVGKFCLEFFADYYGIVYPGDKLDLVAIPDFAFGAMENLGCVTFREVLLLVDPEQVTQPELQNVTDVIAHELAHMWFGDLVTMKWWNGIWLNEAFATFMEMLATDAFRPEWDRWTTFGLSRSAAFDVDSLRSTRPIEYEVISPADAEGMFDILTYEKGGAVVRMLEQYLGADAFRDGIRHYLARHQYSNTETTDLWDAIEDATGEPVRRIMDSWIFQGGFPLIEAEIVRNDLEVPEPGVLRITQRRFQYASDLDHIAEDTPQSWVVPILLSQNLRPNPAEPPVLAVEKVLLEGESMDIPLTEDFEWILLNTEGTGFYRVHYSDELLGALAANAQSDLSPIERYGLIDDAWALVLAARMHLPDFLDFVSTFSSETDLSVWERIISALRFCDTLVEGAARTRFQAFVRELVSPAFDRLGPEPRDGERERDTELRGALFEALGVLGADHAAASRARELHQLAVSSAQPVDPSLLAASISIIATTGDATEFEQFLDRFGHAATPQEEVRYLYALADFADAGLIDRLLAMTVSDAIRTQNAPYVIRRALANRHQGPRAWQFVRDNWKTINDRFPSNSIARMLEGIRSLHDPEISQTVFAFFETHEVPQGDKILAQHLERLEVNVLLREREADRLTNHLLH
ncbi:MAG: M1 family metallopeptidase [Acidimicrobiales bacterium]|nr:M1 family metallopeptidase [Acidimicrobiales bacterium]